MESPCLNCGGQMRITMKNGVLLGAEPDGIHGYVDVPFAKWAADWPYT